MFGGTHSRGNTYNCDTGTPEDDSEFSFTAAVRGFHVYRRAWLPHLGQHLSTEQKHGNAEYCFPIAGGEGWCTNEWGDVFTAKVNINCCLRYLHNILIRSEQSNRMWFTHVNVHKTDKQTFPAETRCSKADSQIKNFIEGALSRFNHKRAPMSCLQWLLNALKANNRTNTMEPPAFKVKSWQYTTPWMATSPWCS